MLDRIINSEPALADRPCAMASPESNPYLRDAVMTATPEQLQMMLYDGAIRFATQGRDAIEASDFEAVYENLARAQKIVIEMDRGLNHEIAPDLCERMSALYMFVYRCLVDGCVQRVTGPVDDALRILQFERDTWRMLMEKLAAERDAASPSMATPAPAAGTADKESAGSLSIEG